MQLQRFFPKLEPREAKVLVCLIAAVIAAVDFALPDNINVASFYFICIVLIVWTRSVKWLWGSTAIFVLLTFMGVNFARSPIGNTLTWIDLLNRGMTALALVVAAVPVHLRLRAIAALQVTSAERDRAEQALRQSYANLEARVQERTQELHAEIAEKTRVELNLRESQESLRQLSIRLMNSQDGERRRIASALHDSVGQYLAISKVNLELFLEEAGTSERGMQRLSEIVDSPDKCLSETRNISHLLHPPLLDELGFASATTTYVEGFSRRSNILVEVNIPPELKRLPPGLELLLFRTLQECLTNILRYAHSPRVDIRLKIENSWIALMVRDYGKGMPAELVERLNQGNGDGVGLSGMRERILEFRGNFKVESDGNGTSILATLPMAAAESAKAATG
ncbi:MAG: sensor histidine kinase [Candidatus Acidiferrales bacterium]